MGAASRGAGARVCYRSPGEITRTAKSQQTACRPQGPAGQGPALRQTLDQLVGHSGRLVAVAQQIDDPDGRENRPPTGCLQVEGDEQVAREEQPVNRFLPARMPARRPIARQIGLEPLAPQVVGSLGLGRRMGEDDEPADHAAVPFCREVTSMPSSRGTRSRSRARPAARSSSSPVSTIRAGPCMSVTRMASNAGGIATTL